MRKDKKTPDPKTESSKKGKVGEIEYVAQLSKRYAVLVYLYPLEWISNNKKPPPGEVGSGLPVKSFL